MIINGDQTPSKYIQVGRFTMLPQGAKIVGVVEIADKRMITFILTVPMDGKKLYHLKQFIKEKQSSLYQNLVLPQVVV